MGFGESAIAEVNWRATEIQGGTGEELPDALLALFQSTTEDEAWQAWWRFENKVFAQNTLYGAAEATIYVLMAALADDRPRLVRDWIIELVRFMLNCGSDEDSTLEERCRDQVRQGLWLLAQEARVTGGEAREAVLEVMEKTDPQRAKLVRDALTSAQ